MRYGFLPPGTFVAPGHRTSHSRVTISSTAVVLRTGYKKRRVRPLRNTGARHPVYVTLRSNTARFLVSTRSFYVKRRPRRRVTALVCKSRVRDRKKKKKKPFRTLRTVYVVLFFLSTTHTHAPRVPCSAAARFLGLLVFFFTRIFQPGLGYQMRQLSMRILAHACIISSAPPRRRRRKRPESGGPRRPTRPRNDNYSLFAPTLHCTVPKW